MSGLEIRLLDHEVNNFDCGDQDINEWIENSYYSTLSQQISAYEVKVGKLIIGYIALSIRKVSISHCPDYLSDYIDDSIDSMVPSLCIQYIATDCRIQKRGYGDCILKTFLSMINKCINIQNLYLPIRFLVIDAKLNLVEWYKKNGFQKMGRNHDSQEGVTEYMFIDLIRDIKALEDYADKKAMNDY